MNSKLKEIFGPNFNLAEIDFAPPPASLSILNVESLDSDKLFTSLKKEIEQYYLEKKRSVDQQNLHKNKSPEWKDHFYRALHTLLNEVMFTASSAMKQVLLNKIKKWYIEKTGNSPLPEKKRFPVFKIEEKVESGIIIPQDMEIKPVKKAKRVPYMPKKKLEDDKIYESKQNLFDSLLDSENENSGSAILPKVKNPRNKECFFRPYSPMKDFSYGESPVIKDFRSTSRARSTGISRDQSPDIFRNTAFPLQFPQDSAVLKDFPLVPLLRRIQLKEVMKIKKRFASKRLICPVKVLEGGLVISDFKQESVLPDFFPRGDELLMHDPNGVKKNTKKKHKKGKKSS